MFKFLLMLFIFIMINSLIFTKSMKIERRDVVEYDGKLILNKVVVSILKNCILDLKNILVYDKNEKSLTFKALTVLQPSIVTTFTTDLGIQKPKNHLNDVEVQGLIVVIDVKQEFSSIIDFIRSSWSCVIDCTVIIIPKPNGFCSEVEMAMENLAKYYITLAYYICMYNNSEPVIYAHDPYGDSQPTHWQVTQRKTVRYNNWTLYRRNFETGSNCQKFAFDRVDILKNTNIVVGSIAPVCSKCLEEFTDSRNNCQTINNLSEKGNIEALTKLLNLNMICIQGTWRPSAKGPRRILDSLFFKYHIDFMLGFSTFQVIPSTLSVFRSPYQHFYAIISHNQGFATPLEKIMNFYGFLTLVSLAIILSMTFIVILLKTGRNYNWAGFDVLRLLINSEVTVPLDTFSLKIFFCMVFLYFLIIHATFSGHLAEFLTIPKLRKNIDSIADLRDPRIKVVYTYIMNFGNSEDWNSLRSKIIDIKDPLLCIEMMVKNSDSVCVNHLHYIYLFLAENPTNRAYYASKNQYPLISAVMPYRKRYRLAEHVNRALNVISEAKIYYRDYENFKNDNLFALRKSDERAQIDFRAIILKDLDFAFIFLSVGLSVAFLIFLIEILINWKRQNNFNWKTIIKNINIFKKRPVNARPTRTRIIKVRPIVV